MPRGPRFIFENAFYHVFNRGINKQEIFLTEDDYLFFLDKLCDLKGKYDHSLYAYCLMPNHFHLSIQTRKASISTIMASLTTSFSMHFNKSHKHFGSVFQNRFKSILIEDNSYFQKLTQYIYYNPVKAGLVRNPLDYEYSSIKEALGKKPLSFLDEDIIRLIGETEKERKQYEEFIRGGINADFTDMESLFEKEEAVLGTNRFYSLSQKKYLRRKRKLLNV